jgi:1-phosphatidylinositol-4-phosphate 5-kinase
MGPLQVRFVVMNNVFRTDLPIHRKYDLKGSTLGRSSLLDKGAGGHPSSILKDLDLDIIFKLEEGWPDRSAFPFLANHPAFHHKD